MLRRAGEILEAEARAFAAVMTAEMGKLLGAAVQEAEKCAAGCRYYADHAEEFLAARGDRGIGGRPATR